MISKITLIFAAVLLLAVILVINLVLMAGDLPLAEIATTLLRGRPKPMNSRFSSISRSRVP